MGVVKPIIVFVLSLQIETPLIILYQCEGIAPGDCFAKEKKR
jgi:hypothetical protein